MFGDFIPYVGNVMNYSSKNSEVIANNIANFNTPAFKTQALQFEQVLNGEMRLKLNTQDEQHIKNTRGAMEVPTSSIVQESGGKARVDGNNVDQTAEMIKMLKNNYVHSTSVNALNKEFSLFRTAIGR